MRLKTQNGNFLIFSETNKNAVYYTQCEGLEYLQEGGVPGKILKVLSSGEREFEWAKKTWGAEPQPLSEAEKILLERTAAFRRNIKNIAIKNSKGESRILSESEFFKTKQGMLLSLAIGRTHRRVHQGSNGWSLFNIEGTMPERPEQPKKERWVDFGTYGGAEYNIKWLYESDLIPISKSEWEKISGREFVLEYEFSWFKGGLERQVLPAGESLHSGGMSHQHPRIAKTKLAAKRAGYDVFEPVDDLKISTETGKIVFPHESFSAAKQNCWTINSAVGLEFIRANKKVFDIYYVYTPFACSQAWVSKKPFTMRNYSLNSEGNLSVYEQKVDTWAFCDHRANMVAILKSTKLPEGWNLVDGDFLHLSEDSWDKIKNLHPYYTKYGEGENNFSPEEYFKEKVINQNKIASFSLGDLESLQDLKNKLA